MDQLEAARPILPEPQYDVLLGLACGMTPDEVWAEVAGSQEVRADYDTDDIGVAWPAPPRAWCWSAARTS